PSGAAKASAACSLWLVPQELPGRERVDRTLARGRGSPGPRQRRKTDHVLILGGCRGRRKNLTRPVGAHPARAGRRPLARPGKFVREVSVLVRSFEKCGPDTLGARPFRRTSCGCPERVRSYEYRISPFCPLNLTSGERSLLLRQERQSHQP